MEFQPNLQSNEISKAEINPETAMETREQINEGQENKRVNILTNFIEKNKTKFTLVMNSTPIGAVTIPYETMTGKTLDGEKLTGANKVIYSILSVTKIGSAALFLSPLISQMVGGEIDGVEETIKSTTGFITGTIWQAVYLGHRYAMNPEAVTDYLDKKPKLKKISLWVAENLEKFNFTKKVISENLAKIDMDKIESALNRENGLVEKTS